MDINTELASREVVVTKQVYIPKNHVSILTLLSEGYKSGEIADKLGINRRTLEKQIQNMCLYYRARNVTHLVAIAIRTIVII